VAFPAAAFTVAARLASLARAALEGTVPAETLGIAAVAASAAVPPAGPMAFARAFPCEVAGRWGLDRLAHPEEGLEPPKETLGHGRGRLGRAVRVPLRPRVLARALVARVARLALEPRVTRLALVTRIARLAGLPRIAGLARLARVARLALERVIPGIAPVETGLSRLRGRAVGGVLPAVRAEGGSFIASGGFVPFERLVLNLRRGG
jgi:hypothetical protein